MIKGVFRSKSCWILLKTNAAFKIHLILFTGFSWIWSPVVAQPLSRQELQSLSYSYKEAALNEFREFLAIPNYGVSKDQVLANLDWCKNKFQKLGFNLTEIDTKGMPLLVAQNKPMKDKKTILFYLQIDGQPVKAELWDQANPYEAVLKKKINEGVWQEVNWDKIKEEIDPEWHLFARSAADAKGPAFGFMKALEILKETQQQIPFNVKVIMDFEEELGSPHLEEVVTEHRQLLRADGLVIMDGVRSMMNVPSLTFGARGNTSMILTIFGPRTVLHSGHYGNYAPNPVFLTARLIASLKDEKGKVLVPGFYDGVVIDDTLKMALDRIPENRDELLGKIGVAEPEQVGESYQESLQYPSLNIRGIQAGWVGEDRRTIIPDKVVVEFDMRLVKATPGERQIELLKDHIKNQGFYLVSGEPTDQERLMYNKIASLEYKIGSKPFLTDYGGTMDFWLTSALKKATGVEPLRIRMTGGSQPIAPFVNTLGIPAIAVRIGNPDANHHAPNENLRVGNFFEGIETCLKILTENFNGVDP